MKPKYVEVRLNVLIEEHVERYDEEEQKDICQERDAECLPKIVVLIAVEQIEQSAENDASDERRDESDDYQYERQQRINSIHDTRTADAAFKCLREHAARKEQNDEYQKSNHHTNTKSDTGFCEYLPPRIIIRLIS